jgi:putative FmdB family regulatory protein
MTSMPIFEYRCDACGKQFERFVRPSREPSTDVLSCPSCGGQNLQQLLSSFAVSSADTRQLHRNQGRTVAQKDLTEQKHAEMEAVVHHHREHEH